MVAPATLADAAARFGVVVGPPLERGGAPDGAVYPCERDDTSAFLKLTPVAAAPTTPDGSASAPPLAAAYDRVALAEHVRPWVRVPVHLASRDGHLLEIVPDAAGPGSAGPGTLGDARLVGATLTARASGRHLTMPTDLTPGVVRAWAGALGRFHAATHDWSGGQALPTWREEHAMFLAGCRDDDVGVAWTELGETLAALPTTPDCFGVVHNDLHSGNLLLDDDGSVTVLDLDVASHHWYATDLAILLAHPLWALRRRDPARMQPFVDDAVAAYLEQHPLPAGRLSDVPLLMRYRLTLFLLAMQADLGDSPMPAWLRSLRAWALSGEPLAEVRL